MHAEARRRHHAGGVEGEDVALAAGVVADGDAARRGVRLFGEQVVGEPRRGLPDDEAVHPQRTGADGRAQAGRSEHQAPVEALGEDVVGAGEEGAQLVTHVVVGLGGEPALGDLARGRHDSRVRSSTRGRGPTWLITSAAAIEPMRPHSARSSWRV